MQTSRTLSMTGKLAARVTRAPGPGLLWKIRNLPHLLRGWRAIVGPLLGFSGFYAQLSARLHRADGTVVNYGVISRRKLTTAFVNFMVDQLQAETATWGDFKYHDSGTGTLAESNSDTALGTPTGDTRGTGTQTEGGHGEHLQERRHAELHGHACHHRARPVQRPHQRHAHGPLGVCGD